MKPRSLKTADILPFGDTRLRAVCKPITVFHGGLGSKIDLIKNTLAAHGGGAALAAPQIGFLRRVVVIKYLGEYHELVNPVIEAASGAVEGFEGCLSLPGFLGNVTRAETVRVTFQNRHGDVVTLERSGDMARCFQHEIDHLDGVLFIDRMTEERVFNERTNEILRVSDLRGLTEARYVGEAEGPGKWTSTTRPWG